jgi:hypothetical protein
MRTRTARYRVDVVAERSKREPGQQAGLPAQRHGAEGGSPDTPGRRACSLLTSQGWNAYLASHGGKRLAALRFERRAAGTRKSCGRGASA